MHPRDMTRNRHFVNTATLALIRPLQLFSTCTKQELAHIAGAMTMVTVQRGGTVVRQGTPGYEFFVIVEGWASVTINGTRVTTLRSGEFFGEIALLDEAPRTATVVAETDLVLLVCQLSEFASIMAASPTFTRKLLTGVTRRLRDTLRGAPEDMIA